MYKRLFRLTRNRMQRVWKWCRCIAVWAPFTFFCMFQPFNFAVDIKLISRVFPKIARQQQRPQHQQTIHCNCIVLWQKPQIIINQNTADHISLLFPINAPVFCCKILGNENCQIDKFIDSDFIRLVSPRAFVNLFPFCDNFCWQIFCFPFHMLFAIQAAVKTNSIYLHFDMRKTVSLQITICWFYKIIVFNEINVCQFTNILNCFQVFISIFGLQISALEKCR